MFNLWKWVKGVPWKSTSVAPSDETVVKRWHDGMHTFVQDYAERMYGTSADPDQIPINDESYRKITAISPDALLCLEDAQGSLLSWSVCLPTTRELADLFCEGTITEKELFERTPVGITYDALYLCSIITLPEYQRRGYASTLLREGIARFPEANTYLCVWAWSKGGRALVRFAKKNGYVIYARK